MRLKVAVIISLTWGSLAASAASLDWSGNYRFEWTQIDRPSLTTPQESKAYGLHYLSLSPKIIASDGFNIVSRFDVLNSQDPAYQNSQVGQIWGTGLPATTTTDGSRRNTTTQNQNTSAVQVSQLYLHLSQEYGSLLVGRAPLHFGLGMTYNAGNGSFDHWYDTRDLVSYKFIVGNLYFTPTFARVYDEDYWEGNVIQDELLEIGYDAVDSQAKIAFLLERRNASHGVNDLDTTRILPASMTGSVIGGYSHQRNTFLLSRQWSRFGFKIEGSFLTGDTGVQTAGGENVKINSYGIATEFNFPNPGSAWQWEARAGVATGDDPTTADYEGFQFDRNYDVAFMLFNHRLGQRDFHTTNMIKDQSAGRGVHNSVDDEAIGNAWYLSPRVRYTWNDKIDIYNTVTYAQAWVNPTDSKDFSKELGWEYDLEIAYRPRERVQWVNQIGFFQPGAAYEDGVSKLSTDPVFGFASKLSVSF